MKAVLLERVPGGKCGMSTLVSSIVPSLVLILTGISVRTYLVLMLGGQYRGVYAVMLLMGPAASRLLKDRLVG